MFVFVFVYDVSVHFPSFLKGSRSSPVLAVGIGVGLGLAFILTALPVLLWRFRKIKGSDYSSMSHVYNIHILPKVCKPYVLFPITGVLLSSTLP